jgi:hypothetical protein
MSETARRSPQAAKSMGHFLLKEVPARSSFVWVVLFSVTINSLLLVLPFYSIQVFDRVITSGSIETLIGLTVMAVAALAFSTGFEILRGRLLGAAGGGTARRHRRRGDRGFRGGGRRPLGCGLNGVFLTSSGERKPPLIMIMRATINQDILTALRIVSVAAMT